MMRSLIILLFILIGQYCNGQILDRDAFLEQISSDYDKSGSYVCIFIGDELYAISNNELLLYLITAYDISEKNYSSLLYIHLKYDIPFCFNLEEMKSECTTIQKITMSNAIEVADKNIFISEYFEKNGVYKGCYDTLDLPNIIYQLFQWNIPVKIDDYSGCVYIEIKK